MKCEEMIKEVYFVAGVLEGIARANHDLTEAGVFLLDDCASRLEMVGAQLIADSAPTLQVSGMPSSEEMIQYLGKKKVISREGRPQETFGRIYPPEEASDQ